MRFLLLTFLCALVTYPFANIEAQTGIRRVWAVDDGERVKQDELNSWAVSSSDNTVWNGSGVNVFGGRNEVVAFQLMLEGGNTGASSVNVRLDSLVSGGNVITNTGGSGDPYDYVGKRIELFLEHYINVTERSENTWSGGWVWPGPSSAYTGPLPDALIPFESPSGSKSHGQGGAPFSIGANKNQGVWVDIYVPKGSPAGTYTGTIRVTESGSVTYTIPIQLEVYSFTLPDESHFHNFFHFDWPGIAGRHGVSEGSNAYWDLVRKYIQMGHRHRADITQGRVSLSTFSSKLGGFYSGSMYTAANHYDGPGTGIGNKMYSIGTYDQPKSSSVSGFTPDTETGWSAAATAWDGWFASNAPDVWRFKYMIDEPAEFGDKASNFAIIAQRSGWIHRNSSLKTLVTTNAVEMSLDPSIDYWALTGQCSGGMSYSLSQVNQVKANGKKVGIYNGTYPYFASPHLDMPASQMRVNPWIAWKYGVDFYYFWFVDEWGDDTGGPFNPWDVNKLWGSWGNANWFYAGQDKLYPGDDRGLAGPISSIRLKNWRRGQQDYEYLWLAQQQGINTTAIVNGVVPKALSDAPNTSPAPWAERGYQFEGARRQLAGLLSGAASAPPPVPGLILPSDGSIGVSTDLTLTWNTAVGAISYQVQVSTSQAFSTTVMNQSGITNTWVAVNALSQNTTYYWRVRASNDAGTGTWSGTRSFSTTALTIPTAPALGLPSNGDTTVSASPTLTWNASPGAVSYQVQLSTSQNFSSFILNQSGVTNTWYTAGPLVKNTRH